MPASRREFADESHRKAINGGDPIRGIWNAGALKAGAESRNAGIRVGQDEDRLILRMRDEGVRDQLRLPATCRGSYRPSLYS